MDSKIEEVLLIMDLLEKKKQKQKIKKTKLVCSGGGAKGIGYIGALEALEDLGLIDNFDTFSGSSIGALFCMLITLGYTSSELKDIFKPNILTKIKNKINSNILSDLGFDNGNDLNEFLVSLMQKKNFPHYITLKEHYEKTKKKIIMTGACLNEGKGYYFSVDSYPDMKILDAVMISMCIPILFTPKKYNEMLFVDGGCIDHYPIDIFINEIDSVLGIYLTDVSTDAVTKINIDNIGDLFMGIVKCIYECKTFCSYKGFIKQTIFLKIEISVLSFDIDEYTINKIIKTSYDDTIKYFTASLSS